MQSPVRGESYAGKLWPVAVVTPLIMAAALSALLLGPSADAPRALLPEGTPLNEALDTIRIMPDAERLALQAREERALSANPMDARAVKNLAVLAEASGQTDRAKALTRLAGDRNLRDLGTQSALVQMMMADKDYRGALYRLDGLTRAREREADKMLPSLAAFASDKDQREALVEMLKTDPPWRSVFIAYVTNGQFDVATAYQLIAALRQAGSPVTNQELGLLVDRLVDRKDYDKAYFIWLNSLSEAELRRAGSVFDGEFNAELSNRIFDWTFRPVKNVEFRLTPRAAGSVDRVARLDFAPGRTAFNHLFQFIRLSPGNYVLTGEGKSENLENAGGLVWRIRCAGQDGPPLAETPALRGSMAWAPFEAALTVPETGCDTQLLRLELNAKAVLDQDISGRVFYDNLAINRREAAAPPP